MSRPALKPDPLAKAGTWQGGWWMFGAWLLGLIVLLELAAWLLGDLFNLHFGWTMAFLVLVGIGMSVPYGWTWLNDRLPPPKTDEPLKIVAVVEGPTNPDATYVFGQPPGGKSSGPSWLKKAGPKDLKPLPHALYWVFIKAPTILGDALLVAAWSTWGRVKGAEGTRDQSADALKHEYHSPDREHF
ncbi:MAG: hypothetical protein AB7V42_14110 [Thermoleophilia bacterium]